MLAVEAPKVGDTVTGVVTGVVGAQTTVDPESGEEVTRLRYEVELEEALDAVDVLPQEPAGGVEPHAGEPEPKPTSSDQPDRKARFEAEMKASKERAEARVEEAKGTADQNAQNKAAADRNPNPTVQNK